MQTTGCDSLRDAVCLAVRTLGTEVLNDPNRFMSILADATDPDSREMCLLYSRCDSALMTPFWWPQPKAPLMTLRRRLGKELGA